MTQETEDRAVPPQGLNWWATLRDVLPDDDVLAAAVAEELDEPLEDVRPSVMTATLVRRVDASLDDLKAVVDGERARVAGPRLASTRRSGARRLRAETLEGLLAETRRLADAGTLDLPAAVAVQRAAGGIAARSGMRLVLFLARLAVIRRLVWDRCVDEQRAGRLDADALGEMGRWIFLWTEITSLVVTDGYRAAEREILARDAQARRSALEELLGVVASDALTTARLRRVATRFGLDPDERYRLVAVAPRQEADPTPDRAGIDEGDLEPPRRSHRAPARVGGRRRGGRRRRDPAAGGAADARPHRAARARRLGGLRPYHGGAGRYAGGPCTGRARLAARLGLGRRPAGRKPSAWVAVGSPAVDGVAPIARVLADVVDAARTAEDVGRRGWVPDPGHLAVERLLLGSATSATPPSSTSWSAARRRPSRYGARRDAPGLLRLRGEHARGRPPPPSRQPDGRVSAREGRGPAGRVPRRRVPPPARGRPARPAAPGGRGLMLGTLIVSPLASRIRAEATRHRITGQVTAAMMDRGVTEIRRDPYRDPVRATRARCGSSRPRPMRGARRRARDDLVRGRLPGRASMPASSRPHRARRSRRYGVAAYFLRPAGSSPTSNPSRPS